MKALLFHLVFLAIHSYHMWLSFSWFGGITLDSFWRSITFLTNFSNLNMFWFLIPYVWTDLTGKSGKYPLLAQKTFQVMTPVMFLVGFMYYLMYFLDPKLLFGDKDHTQYDQFLMFYLHGGNFILMQLEHFVNPQPNIPTSSKAAWIFIYVVIYFIIYGINFVVFNKHVYGFQEMMTPFEVVAMYTALFVTLFLIDMIYSTFVYRKNHVEATSSKPQQKTQRRRE